MSQATTSRYLSTRDRRQPMVARPLAAVPNVAELTGHVHAKRLARLRRLATVMDDAFRIPFTKFRFGLDGMIGLVPGLGDTAAALISTYIIYHAARMGVPRATLARMGSNLALDYVVGLMPVLGDLLDVAFKANRKNVDLLEAHLRSQLTDVTTQPGSTAQLGSMAKAGSSLQNAQQ